MKTAYLDLQVGDKLRIDGYGIRIININVDGLVRVMTQRGKTDLRRSHFLLFDDRTKIYNFGRRGRGDRVHIRMEYDDDYAHFRRQNVN